MTSHRAGIRLALTAFALPLAFACNNQFPFGNAGGTNTSRDVIPDAITLDIDEIGDEETNAAKMKDADAARCTGDPAVDRTLRAGAVVVHAFHRAADRALALGARIKLDIDDPTQTQVEGQFQVAGQTVSYKADFAAFDIDGDSVADGSGMANVEPVALRMWVDMGDGNGFSQFLCALITTRPSKENLGAGEIYCKPIIADALSSPDLQVHVTFDRTDPAHKWNEAFVSGRVRGDVEVSVGRHRVDVRSSDAGVEKTIRSSTNFVQHPLGFANYQFAAHFLRGGGAVLLSGESTGGSIQVNFDSTCVDVTTCVIDAGGAACAAFDTQDMTFLDAPIGDETAFPAGFPASPTF